MARPQKNNADYISHDVGMRNHRKVKAVRSKFGIEWYAIWCMLLEYLGSCNFFEATIDDIEWEILSGDFGVSCDRLQQVVEYLLQIGMLQKEWNIYRSQSLIDRLQPMLEKRDRERNRVSVAETDKLWQVVAEMPQSKVKESKEEIIETTKVVRSKAAPKKKKTIKPTTHDTEAAQEDKTVLAETEDAKKEYGNPEVKKMLSVIKFQCKALGLAYDNYKESNFARHLCTAKVYGERAESIGKTRTEAAIEVLNLSVLVWHRKGYATWPAKIYQNYSEIYNKAIQLKNEEGKNEPLSTRKVF